MILRVAILLIGFSNAEDLMSHLPHTRGSEEIVLVLEGEVEMLKGENSYQGKKGDVFFVPIKASHNVKNTCKDDAAISLFNGIKK